MRGKERDALGGLDEGFLCAFTNFWRRFEVWGRSICVVAECECVSRSIPGGKGGVGEDAAREAWPRVLSQYGAR